MFTKQIIIARRDLNMSPGKLAAQVAHASMAAVFQLARIYEVSKEMSFDLREHTVLENWLINSSFTKIVLGVDSEEALFDLYDKLNLSGMKPVMITDNGKTEFGGVPTNTCIGLPPYDAQEINKFTGTLRLY